MKWENLIDSLSLFLSFSYNDYNGNNHDDGRNGSKNCFQMNMQMWHERVNYCIKDMNLRKSHNHRTFCWSSGFFGGREEIYRIYSWRDPFSPSLQFVISSSYANDSLVVRREEFEGKRGRQEEDTSREEQNIHRAAPKLSYQEWEDVVSWEEHQTALLFAVSQSSRHMMMIWSSAAILLNGSSSEVSCGGLKGRADNWKEARRYE